MEYIVHILIMICIYGILALSLNLLVGYSGLLSLSHAAFYAIGAYTTTLFMMNAEFNFFTALIYGIIVTAISAIFIAYPSLRLKGDYFILTSLGFQLIIFNILYNWVGLTKGPYGIPGIPKPKLFGIEFYSNYLYLLLSIFFFSMVFIFFRLLYNSPFGRALKALREDEIAAGALGKEVPKLKIWAFIIASAIAAIAGALYASYITYIDPTSFTLDESIFIVSILLIGGSGNIKGPLVGTVFMIILPELLRFIGLPNTIAPNVRQMIYGLLLIILMRYRPQGLAGEYRFE